MKHKNYLITEIKKIIKSELKIKVDEKSKIYDHIKWDSLGNFNILLAVKENSKLNSQILNLVKLIVLKK